MAQRMMENSSCLNCSTATNKTTEIYNTLPSVAAFLSIFTLFITFAVLGNILVCWIVKVNRRMHDITNYLLVNLAVSDLLMALSTIFQVIDFAVKDLNLGNVGCKFQINMVNIPYSSSVLTLTFIAYERYSAICKPMDFGDIKERIRKWIIPSIWLLSFSIYFPTIYYCGSRLNTEDNQLSCDCTYRWPSLRAKNIYGVFIVVALYAIPFVVIVRLYSAVIHKLKEVIPGDGEGNMSVYRSRQGVVKMLVVSGVVFFISWTPYNVLYLLKRLEVDYRSIYKYVWYPSLLLAGIHCACNPVIYCLLGNNFRAGLKSALRDFRCRFPQFVQTYLERSSTSRPTRQPTGQINLAMIQES